MLIHAFAGEVLDRVKIEPLRVALEAELYAQLAQGSRGGRRGMTPVAARARGRPRSTSRGCGPTSRSCGAQVHGKPLVYLDNAATTQKPQAVLDAIARYYDRRQRQRAPRRARAERARDRRVRGARARRCARFFNAPSAARDRLHAQRHRGHQPGRARASGDAQRRRRRRGAHLRRWSTTRTSCPGSWSASATGARLRVVPIDDRGELMLDEFERLLDAADADRRRSRTCRTRSARSTRSSEIVALAHARGVPVLIDGAQAAYHMPVDVQALDCDFYVVPGHKLYGPTGIGVLYGTGRAARGDAAVPGRRRHDPLGDASRRRTWNDAAVQVRGRHAGHRRRDRPRRGARLHRARSASTRSRAHEHDAARRTRPRAARAIPGVRLIGTARAARRASCRSCWTASTRTTSARSSTARASRSAPAITARSR